MIRDDLRSFHETAEVATATDSVKDRLQQSLSFGEELQASSFILQTIESGYVLPLKSEPTSFSRKNQNSALQNYKFVKKYIADLLATGCVEVVAEPLHVCSPLSVVENCAGKRRLVLNLRHVNKFLWKQKFKYEDLRIAMMLFKRGDYLFSFDLKSSYHHVDIAKHHWKYLGFNWEGMNYVFTVLPLGLSTTCYMFTKIVRPLDRYWRARGLHILVLEG